MHKILGVLSVLSAFWSITMEIPEESGFGSMIDIMGAMILKDVLLGLSGVFAIIALILGVRARRKSRNSLEVKKL